MASNHFIDQNLRRQMDSHAPVQSSFPIGLAEVGDQIVRGHEVSCESGLNGGFGQGQAQVRFALLGNPSQSPPPQVVQTRPFSCQVFSVRKTPVFRTPTDGENRTRPEVVPGATGVAIELHGRDATVMANLPLFKRATESTRSSLHIIKESSSASLQRTIFKIWHADT
jgi:hypothetical protein